MKKASTYLPSLILSIILVFLLLLTEGFITFFACVTEKKADKLISDEQIYSKIYAQLDNYFTDKYNTTGIPKEVFLDAVDEDYIRKATEASVANGFQTLETGRVTEVQIPVNEALEKSITDFFNNYADETGYEKDEAFEKKLQTTIKKAYSVIYDNCDVFKFKALSSHGITVKMSRICQFGAFVPIAFIALDIIMLLIILLINRKEKASAFYWAGNSFIIAALFTVIPAVYLLADKFYDSFSIKQPAIYSAYTSAMYGITKALLAAGIAYIAAGILSMIFYKIFSAPKEK